MRKPWGEKQSGALQGKWYQYKSMGYELLFINGLEEENSIRLEYFVERSGHVEKM